VPHPMALDDVAGLDIIGEKDRLVPDRAARLLDLPDRPDAVRLDRPQRQPGAVRTVEHVTALDPGRDLDLLPSAGAPDLAHEQVRLREPQQAFEPAAVEADDVLAVDDGHRRCLVPEPDQFLESGRVLANVLDRESDPFPRKKLFLVVAGPSAGLTVDDHVPGHQAPPLLPLHCTALRFRRDVTPPPGFRIRTHSEIR